jgi:hypothetical protein
LYGGEKSAELPAEFSAAELADCLSAYSANPLFCSARFEKLEIDDDPGASGGRLWPATARPRTIRISGPPSRSWAPTSGFGTKPGLGVMS